jgi:hypothetical protein
LPPAAAEYYFEIDVFFMILLCKIMKNTSVSNFNLARSALKRLFTQPQKPFYTTSNGYLARSTKKDILYIPKHYFQ